MKLIRNYFADVCEILAHPSRFFDRMPIRGGMSGPLGFALVTHWIGAAFGFIWNTLLIRGTPFHFLQSMIQMSSQISGTSMEIDSPGRSAQLDQIKDRILNWIFGAGPIVIDPFLTLFSILFTSFLVYLGARILVTPRKDGHPDEISFESALRIICYGMTPTILSVIPVMGTWIASLGVIIVTIIGAKRVYRIQTGRAIIVALFPKVLFFGIIGMGLLVFFLVIVKLFTLFF
jgi:hypothetical protein